MTDTKKSESYPYMLGRCQIELEFTQKDRNGLLGLLSEVAELIENYADDHSSDYPTDVTVILPRLRAELSRSGAFRSTPKA